MRFVDKLQAIIFVDARTYHEFISDKSLQEWLEEANVSLTPTKTHRYAIGFPWDAFKTNEIGQVILKIPRKSSFIPSVSKVLETLSD